MHGGELNPQVCRNYHREHTIREHRKGTRAHVPISTTPNDEDIDLVASIRVMQTFLPSSAGETIVWIGRREKSKQALNRMGNLQENVRKKSMDTEMQIMHASNAIGDQAISTKMLFRNVRLCVLFVAWI